jgi:cob(I)alamin adenosyltransferase
MSIATTRGDGGQTGLAGGIRISKASLRVDTYGTTDELKTVLGFARSISNDVQVNAWTEAIQRTLFRVGSALATPPESKKQPPIITEEDIHILDTILLELEVRNNSSHIAEDNSAAAAFNIARTICHRSERNVMRFIESGAVIQPNILIWLNRLSDVLAAFSHTLQPEHTRV